MLRKILEKIIKIISIIISLLFGGLINQNTEKKDNIKQKDEKKTKEAKKIHNNKANIEEDIPFGSKNINVETYYKKLDITLMKIEKIEFEIDYIITTNDLYKIKKAVNTLKSDVLYIDKECQYSESSETVDIKKMIEKCNDKLDSIDIKLEKLELISKQKEVVDTNLENKSSTEFEKNDIEIEQKQNSKEKHAEKNKTKEEIPQKKHLEINQVKEEISDKKQHLVDDENILDINGYIPLVLEEKIEKANTKIDKKISSEKVELDNELKEKIHELESLKLKTEKKDDHIETMPNVIIKDYKDIKLNLSVDKTLPKSSKKEENPSKREDKEIIVKSSEGKIRNEKINLENVEKKISNETINKVKSFISKARILSSTPAQSNINNLMIQLNVNNNLRKARRKNNRMVKVINPKLLIRRVKPKNVKIQLEKTMIDNLRQISFLKQELLKNYPYLYVVELIMELEELELELNAKLNEFDNKKDERTIKRR